LQQGTLGKIPIGLPPLAEQHRIVAKLDELMGLCDRLETSLATADDTRSVCSTRYCMGHLPRLKSGNWRRRNNANPARTGITALLKKPPADSPESLESILEAVWLRRTSLRMTTQPNSAW
jgi:hypothetical protein